MQADIRGGGQRGWDSERICKVDLALLADGWGVRYKRTGTKDESRILILSS